MSLKNLLAFAEKSRLFDEGKLPAEEMEAIRFRQKEAQKRMAEFDREIEERVKAKKVTQELLQMVCDL